jgi:transcription initiation factor IIF auxiliary subunit
MSLRSLLKTYDLEFDVLLGNTRQAVAAATATASSSSSTTTTKSETIMTSRRIVSEENKAKNYEKALSLKDSLIAELRAELDQSRNEFKERLQQLEADLRLSSSSAGTVQDPSQVQEIMKLKSDCAKAREEIFCLQSISRVDFIPDQTKVWLPPFLLTSSHITSPPLPLIDLKIEKRI